MELGDSLGVGALALSGAMIHAPIINSRFQTPLPTAVELLGFGLMEELEDECITCVKLHSEIFHP